MRDNMKTRFMTKIKFAINDFKVRRRNKTTIKQLSRNWYTDASRLGNSDVRFENDDSVGVNRITLNEKTVVELTYGETALLYRFLKIFVYK